MTIAVARKDQAMFPGANAQVYRNEAGEPVGWDYPSHDDPYDPDDYLPDYDVDEDYEIDDSDHDERACAEMNGDCACDPRSPLSESDYQPAPENLAAILQASVDRARAAQSEGSRS